MAMRRPIVLPVILLLNAAGIVLFWSGWFRRGDHLNASPDYYRLFENTFPLPDGVMALLMVALAVMMFQHRPGSTRLAAWVSGMVTYLFGLDLLYHFTHGAYSAVPQGSFMEATVIAVDTALLGIVLLSWALTRPTPNYGLRPGGASLLAGAFAVYAVVQVMAWAVHATAAAPDTVNKWHFFLDMFILADLLSALVAAAAAAGMWSGRTFGELLGLHVCGGAFFGMLNLASYVVMNPQPATLRAPTGIAGCILIAIVIGVMLYGIWRTGMERRNPRIVG